MAMVDNEKVNFGWISLDGLSIKLINRRGIWRRHRCRFSPNGIGGEGGGMISATSSSAQTHSSKNGGKMAGG